MVAVDGFHVGGQVGGYAARCDMFEPGRVSVRGSEEAAGSPAPAPTFRAR